MARKKWHRNVLTHNEGKSAVAQSVIRTLKKNKLRKCMASISKNVFIDNLDMA